MEKNLKPFWWENIPVIGCLIYLIRTGFKRQDIDRGLLRKQITIWSFIYTFAFLIYPFALISLLTPWLTYAIYSTAIIKTRKKLEKNDPI